MRWLWALDSEGWEARCRARLGGRLEWKTEWNVVCGSRELLVWVVGLCVFLVWLLAEGGIWPVSLRDRGKVTTLA